GAYPWGDHYQIGAANINERFIDTGLYNLDQTTAVGLYPQGTSPYGVFDMAGNLFEWCINKYEEPAVIDFDASDDLRVLRGGSWNDNPEGARSAFRYGSSQTTSTALWVFGCCVPAHFDSLTGRLWPPALRPPLRGGLDFINKLHICIK
ncbi:MAG: SUMF1/EgtB/PvdO family nonheme iron enzyme, partial [gamma proteobacterium symbiont of Ctena orbiculata]